MERGGAVVFNAWPIAEEVYRIFVSLFSVLFLFQLPLNTLDILHALQDCRLQFKMYFVFVLSHKV